MRRRRAPASLPARFLSALTLRKKPRRPRTAAGSTQRRPLSGTRRTGSTARPFRATALLGGFLVLLGALNAYVLYYRRNTSVPALMDLANSGRRASLSPRLSGPTGTPPTPRPSARHAQGPSPLPDYAKVTEFALRIGEPMAAQLAQRGVTGNAAEELLAALRPLLDPGGVAPSQSLTFYRDAEDQLAGVDYRPNEGVTYHLARVRTGSTQRYLATRWDLTLRRETARVDLAVDHDRRLLTAVTRAGEQPALAARLVEIFACEANLLTDLRFGDRLRVIIEKVYLGDGFYRYGRLLAAELAPLVPWESSRSGRLRAFLGPGAHRTPDNAGAALGAALHYFSETGESLARSVCKSPLQYAKLLDTQSAERSLRPTPQTPKGALGLDYPAPANTPVVALAAGRVSAIQKRANAWSVVISNSNDQELTYQQLGRVARPLTVGQPVQLRQVLGYVAAAPSQGQQTFVRISIRQRGRPADLLRLRPPREPAVPAAARPAFDAHVAEALDQLAQSSPGRPLAAR